MLCISLWHSSLPNWAELRISRAFIRILYTSQHPFKVLATDNEHHTPTAIGYGVYL